MKINELNGFSHFSKVISLTLGEAQKFKILSVSPNPSDAFIDIQFENPMADDAIFDVYNALGELIFSEKNKGLTVQKRLNTEGWSSGVYLLKIQSKSEGASFRFVKK